MATIISHAFVGIAAAQVLAPAGLPIRFCVASLVCSVLPDADVLSFHFDVPYLHPFGHRGFFHSFSFAAILSGFVTLLLLGQEERFSRRSLLYFAFFFIVTASHGILDAFTDGGFGIALFSPFDNRRVFFPWTPIMVSPLGIKAFFSRWGFLVLKNEMLWIWLPGGILVAISALIRNACKRFWGCSSHSP